MENIENKTKRNPVKRRREAIQRTVEEQGFCTVAELSVLTEVSEMTVRRDVQILVDQEILRSFHGGVSAFASKDFLGIDYRQREFSAGQLKQSLARYAAKFVSDGDSIALDAGTTMAALAQEIRSFENLNIVTASIPAFNVLSTEDALTITLLGGLYYPGSQSVSGPAAIQAIENIHVDTFFLAASRVSERGAYCANDFDAVTKRALIGVADRVVLVADSSKFDQSAIAKICDWDSIDLFIVDEGISAETENAISEYGVTVVQVPVQNDGFL
jgi:DeoR family transcriptional regulator of aga operon